MPLFQSDRIRTVGPLTPFTFYKWKGCELWFAPQQAENRVGPVSEMR
jgi:hypothetical protein